MPIIPDYVRNSVKSNADTPRVRGSGNIDAQESLPVKSAARPTIIERIKAWINRVLK